MLFQDNCCRCSYDKSESNTGQSTVPVNNQCETKRSLVIAQQTEPVMRIDQAEQTSLDYCKCSGKIKTLYELHFQKQLMF